MIFRRNITFRNIDNCFLCEENCRKGLLAKIKPYGFILFAKRYSIETLLNCFEENEKNGIVYHRQGIVGDYDEFEFIVHQYFFKKVLTFTLRHSVCSVSGGGKIENAD